jgi:hypothetical protein
MSCFTLRRIGIPEATIDEIGSKLPDVVDLDDAGTVFQTYGLTRDEIHKSSWRQSVITAYKTALATGRLGLRPAATLVRSGARPGRREHRLASVPRLRWRGCVQRFWTTISHAYRKHDRKELQLRLLRPILRSTERAEHAATSTLNEATAPSHRATRGMQRNPT